MLHPHKGEGALDARLWHLFTSPLVGEDGRGPSANDKHQGGIA